MNRLAPGFLFPLFVLVISGPVSAAEIDCTERMTGVRSAVASWFTSLKNTAVDKLLDVMAIQKGLPAHLKLNEELKVSGRYLNYRNFGEMGLAEMGISVRFNKEKLASLNTGRPLLVVANHHLGIADGLALQHLLGEARPSAPSLLFLARWIEKLLPHAVFGDDHGWGTAIPVEINKPKSSDPRYEEKMAELKTFNSSWSRTSLRALRGGAAAIVFPAGHVAAINDDGQEFPASVYDAPSSWQEGFLNMARLGKADIAFANVVTTNSESFYRNRKRFGGGDKERVIWFFSEALAKKNQTIDVLITEPMSLNEIYERLAQTSGHTKEQLESDNLLTVELMRQLTYQIHQVFPQALDTVSSPRRRP